VSSRIVTSLALPLNARERQRMSHDVPATARAYELYLRANQYAASIGDWATPRDLYLAALEEDPTYAPAWARLGRCYRLIGKYGGGAGREKNFADAQAAFDRAVQLNPDLDLAHSFAAQLETDTGRCGEAMVRLLARLETRPRGVDLLAGLVHALRYCGLMDESVAAHRAARAIDPSALTSVAHTHFLRAEYEAAALETVNTGDFYIRALALLMLGREGEARELLRRTMEHLPAMMRPFVDPLLLMLAGDVEGSADAGERAYAGFPDGEGRYYIARVIAFVGRTERALEFLRGAAPEWWGFPEPGQDAWLAAIDRSDVYARLLVEARAKRERFRARFDEMRKGRSF
jgi:tetratricopeptide (TPR) repeat protein